MAVKIPKESLERVARLARLQLTEEERERFARDLEGILAAFDALHSEPLPESGGAVHPSPVNLPGEPREDEPEPWPRAHELLAGATMSRGLMRGPRVR